MTVSINQPAYLPWLGYYHRIINSDLHIVLDHVQFEKNSFTNRNKLRIKDGSCWVTVPVKTSGKFGELAIQTLEIQNNPAWSRKHIESIRVNYKRAAYFETYFTPLEEILKREWMLLADLMAELNNFSLSALGINTPLRYSSAMKIPGTKSELVLNLCKEVGADTYLSGSMGKDYLDVASFEAANIRVIFQEYIHPRYTQAFPGFEPYMATLDLLLNHGPASIDILSNKIQ